MSVKTAGVGHFSIPTAPAVGTSCTSGAANNFSAAYVQLIASTSAALYITGIYIGAAATLTTQMTESYPALHTAPTLAESLFEARALLGEKSVSGTTLTINKVDGSTAAETFTLNNATSPTAITRAT